MSADGQDKAVNISKNAICSANRRSETTVGRSGKMKRAGRKRGKEYDWAPGRQDKWGISDSRPII